MVTTSNMKIRSQEADCQVAFQFDQPHHPDILYCKPTGGFSCWPCRPSCDDHPHIWPTASAIPEASWMVFCHESLQGLEDQVFLCNAKTGHWRPLYMVAVWGIRTTSTHHRTAWSPTDMCPGPRGEGNDRAVWEGKGWGSRWSSGYHTPFTPTWCLSSLLCPRSGWIVLWNHTLSMSFRGQLGRRLSAGLSIMITAAYSHALPFQDGNTESATLGSLSVVLLCTQPRLGKLTSFLLVIPAPGRLCMHISRKV